MDVLCLLPAGQKAREYLLFRGRGSAYRILHDVIPDLKPSIRSVEYHRVRNSFSKLVLCNKSTMCAITAQQPYWERTGSFGVG